MELNGRKTLVVGLGKTGMETVKFLLEKGADVAASDISPMEKLPSDVRQLQELGVDIETEKHTVETFLRADTVILSPGVPFHLPPVREAMDRGIEVISEIELSSRFIQTPAVGITGSNGKTTTSTLLSQILEASGKKIFLGANIGTPLIKIAGEDENYDLLVLELSSFQLQGITTFRPHVAVLLNISPNHLDHHESFDEYVDAKMKIFSNQTSDDWAIYKEEDPVITELISGITAKKIPFGINGGQNGVFFDGTWVRFGDETYDIREMNLIGRHNLENAMASVACARILGCEPEVIQREIIDFEPLPHRIEFVRELSGARFYNDSKSTSPDATLKALESFPPPIVLIAGGKDKGVSFKNLKREINGKVKHLVLCGDSRFRMKKELGEGVKTTNTVSLEEAVEIAVQGLESGDTVLFSPACSSFDMFSSYQERGDRFKNIVRNL